MLFVTPPMLARAIASYTSGTWQSVWHVWDHYQKKKKKNIQGMEIQDNDE